MGLGLRLGNASLGQTLDERIGIQHVRAHDDTFPHYTTGLRAHGSARKVAILQMAHASYHPEISGASGSSRLVPAAREAPILPVRALAQIMVREGRLSSLHRGPVAALECRGADITHPQEAWDACPRTRRPPIP